MYREPEPKGKGFVSPGLRTETLSDCPLVQEREMAWPVRCDAYQGLRVSDRTRVVFFNFVYETKKKYDSVLAATARAKKRGENSIFRRYYIMPYLMF